MAQPYSGRPPSIDRNELLAHALTWMTLKMICEEPHAMATYHLVQSRMPTTGKSIEAEIKLVVSRGGGVECQ